jgi:hypothetical protein
MTAKRIKCVDVNNSPILPYWIKQLPAKRIFGNLPFPIARLKDVVGSRTGAMLLRLGLAVALRSL